MKNFILAIAILAGTMPATAAEGKDAFSSPVVLAFTSEHCAPCHRDKPALARLEAQGIPVRIIDVEKQPEIADAYRVTRVPTYVVEQNGVEVKRTGNVKLLFSILVAFFVWLIF